MLTHTSTRTTGHDRDRGSVNSDPSPIFLFIVTVVFNDFVADVFNHVFNSVLATNNFFTNSLTLNNNFFVALVVTVFV